MCIAALLININSSLFYNRVHNETPDVNGQYCFCFVFLLIVPENMSLSAGASENHCFTCHTNPRKLIQITREIAEANKGRPAKSSEIAGEG
jgi:hypothetical protein